MTRKTFTICYIFFLSNVLVVVVCPFGLYLLGKQYIPFIYRLDINSLFLYVTT